MADMVGGAAQEMVGPNEFGPVQEGPDDPQDNDTRAGHDEALRAVDIGGHRIKRVPVPAGHVPGRVAPRHTIRQQMRVVGEPDTPVGDRCGVEYGEPKLGVAKETGGVENGGRPRDEPGVRLKRAVAKETQVPEWEHVTARPPHVKNGSGSEGFSPHKSNAKVAALATIFPRHSKNQHNHQPSFLDRVLPPHKTYFNLSARTFFITLLAIMLAVTALVAGLAAGLAKSHPTSPPALASGAATGWVTYNPYGPGQIGACGWAASSDQEFVTAIGHSFFDGDANPNNNPLCGRMIRAQYNGNSVDVKVIDSCGACGPDDLDMAMGPFNALTGEVTGKISPVTWEFL